MPTIDVVRQDVNPYQTANGIRDDTGSRGVDLEGALVTVTYADGTDESLVWEAFDPFTFGGVNGADISMNFGFLWVEMTTNKLLTSLRIDLAPSSSVFDIIFNDDDDPEGGSTPGSRFGSPFEVRSDSESLEGGVTATYSGIVNLVGRPADRDLYTTMLVDFSGLTAGGILGDVEWTSDIDTMQFANDLVAVGTDGEFFPGTSGPDDLVGGTGSDTMQAYDGDDRLTGAAGNDRIDGGNGIDTAAYSGSQNSYTLTLSPTGTSVTDRRSDGNGTDTLIDIEFLDFDTNIFGGPFNLGIFSAPADISADDLESIIELYIAYFNRAPDAEGLYFWGAVFNNGFTLAQIANGFFDQDETRAAYPTGTTNEEFATIVYNNVLGRTPDAGGFEFWVGLLNDGRVARDEFILRVLEGAKADLRPDLGQDFVDQQLADRALLENKTDIGAYFAVHKGMSDVDDAVTAMDLFDGTQASINAAVDAIDGFYADALDPLNGEFLMPLVGVLDDPFLV
jgi:hypothetical protein